MITRIIKNVFKLIYKNLVELDSSYALRRNLKLIASYKSIPYIKPYSNTILSSNTHLGKNCNFNGMVIRGSGKVTIGDNFHSGVEILLINSFHNYNNGTAIPYDSTIIHKDITIEDNVWIGSRVIITGGVTIGEGAIIQAGSVVTQDIPKHAIAGGHPAQVFKYRDIEQYNKLKNEKKFH